MKYLMSTIKKLVEELGTFVLYLMSAIASKVEVAAYKQWTMGKIGIASHFRQQLGVRTCRLSDLINRVYTVKYISQCI